MCIDRGTLSRIDRKLLAGLGRDEEWRMVRIPVSAADWSAWKRYCSMIGVSMGRGLSEFMRRELESVIGSAGEFDQLSDLETELRNWEANLDERERRVTERERTVRERERLASLASHSSAPASRLKIGRNDPCPCRSGLKYKRCHGQ